MDKREFYYKIFISFICSLFVSIIIMKLLISLIKIDNSYYEIAKQYPIDLNLVHPEPKEIMGFVVFWILYVLFFLLFYYFLKKMINIENYIIIYLVTSLMAILGIYVLIFAEDQFFINMSWFMNPIIAVAGGGVWLFLAVIDFKKNIFSFFDYLSLSFVFFISLFCFMPNPMFGTNLFHFSSVFTSVYNVFYGATLGVETRIMYGTYAYLFVPILKIIGFSLSHYAIIIMSMCLIILLCEFYIIKNLIDNSIIKFLTISTCIFFNVFFAVDANYEQFITQQFPLRIFSPMIMIAFIVFSVKKKNNYKTPNILIGGFLCYLAFIINLESAITTCLTWVSANFFFEMIEKKQKKKSFLTVQSIFMAIAAFLLWIFTIELFSYLRKNCFIGLNNFFFTQWVFSKIGFGMLPLPNYLHLYIFIFLVYSFFLGISVKQVFFGMIENKIKGQIIFALTTTGILMLIYYIGRTHNRTLIPFLYPCIILIGYILDKGIKQIGREKDVVKRCWFAFVFFLLFSIISTYGTSFVYVLENSNRFRDFVKRQLYNNYDKNIDLEIKLLWEYKGEDGSVNYLGNNASVISLAAGLKNNFLGEMAADWLSWDDYEYIKEFITNCDGPIIIDKIALAQMTTYIPNEFKKIMKQKGYRVINSSPLSEVFYD